MKIKHLTRWAAALGMTAVLLCGAAFAAEENTIAVQLNGENLTFTDAVPQVKDQRTFLPFRAVFEAMGAEVEWTAEEPDRITAVKGDKTLTMTLGETAAAVTENGISMPITMDVAPYSTADENGIWRTYVPVRFAAQAFGCSVGWDQEAYTVLIVDTEKLLEEALEGKEFTYLEKLTEYTEKYNEGIWDMTMDMEGSVGFMGMTMPMSVTAAGTTENQTGMSMDMNVKLDMTEYLQLAALLGEENVPMSAEDQAMVESLATEGIDLGIRGDLDTGKIYMTLGGSLVETTLNIPADTWLLMDVNALLAESGVDMTMLMQAFKDVDVVKTMFRTFVSTVSLESANYSVGYGWSYWDLKDTAEDLAYIFSDEGFQKDGNSYATAVDDDMMGLKLTFTMSNGKVTGYTMELTMSVSNDELGTAEMQMTVSMDDKDQMEASMSMDMGGLMNMDFAMNAKYTAGKTAPEVTPPAGAVVLPLAEMMSLMDAYGPAAE